MNETVTKTTRGHRFVEFIIRRMEDNGNAAALRRADNPNTEYQSWDTLASFKYGEFEIELDKPWQRLPFTTIASAIAKAKSEQNGTVKIGQAIARCYDDGKESDQAKAKLRRLLACDSVEETCRILRPLFSLIHSKKTVSVDYATLLNDLLYWNNQTTKSRWAEDFYHYKAKEKGGKK